MAHIDMFKVCTKTLKIQEEIPFLRIFENKKIQNLKFCNKMGMKAHFPGFFPSNECSHNFIKI